MNKKCAILVIHGQGNTLRNFAADLEKRLKHKVGSYLWEQLFFDTIYYQRLIQSHQENVWRDMPLSKLRWKQARQLMLYGFSDAVTIEYAASGPNSHYLNVQRVIVQAIRNARKHLRDAHCPIVIIAASLGCHIISNYIWDAQTQANGEQVVGVWHHDLPSLVKGCEYSETEFLRLQTLRYLFTTGCNLPLFIAGHPDIVAINKPHPCRDFTWVNFYDQDDVLGWPLKPLSASYEAIVTEDVEVDSGKFPWNWTPFSHNHYWQNEVFLERVSDSIRHLLGA